MLIKPVVYLNGKFITPQEAEISPLDEGFLFGLALFESLRVYKNKIVYLEKHFLRIKQSALLIGMGFPFQFSRLEKLIREIVCRNGLSDAYLRLTLWKRRLAAGILITAKEYTPYPQVKYKSGFSATISGLRQDGASLLARIKSCNRILYQLSLQEARSENFDEAIILNQRGMIAEGARTNVFFVQDEVIFTPSIECGCLPGVTRQAVFNLAKKYRLKIYAGKFSPQDLKNAQEAFLTNSLIGIMPLSSLEKEEIGKEKCGRLTQFLQKKYLCLFR